MSLGETIYRLRNEKRLSQGDLGDLLGVSRQSVSRWETDGAVPELEKLVKLSQAFGVTLDELVMGGKEEPASVPPPPQTAETATGRGGASTRKVVGTILLCMGFLVVLLLLLIGGDLLFGLLFASPFLLCGSVCLAAKRHVGLWCAWALYLSVDLYLRIAAGLSWKTIRLTMMWSYEMNYVRLAVAWAQFLVMLLLIVLTLVAFRKLRLSLKGKGKILFLAGWVLYVAMFIPLPIPISFYNDFRFLSTFVITLLDWGEVALLTALLAVSLAVWRGRKAA